MPRCYSPPCKRTCLGLHKGGKRTRGCGPSITPRLEPKVAQLHLPIYLKGEPVWGASWGRAWSKWLTALS